MFFKYWIKYRYNVFTSIIIDLILFAYLIQNGDYNQTFFINSLLFISWFFLSYSFERYGIFKKINFKKLFLKSLISGILVYIFINFLFLFSLDFINLNKFLIKIIVCSFIAQMIWINFYFQLKPKKYINIIGSNLYKNYLKKYIDYFNFIDFEYEVDKPINNNQSVSLFEENKLHSKIWFEETLHIIPSKLINNNFIKELKDTNRRGFYLMRKRFADLFISSILLFLSIPILILSSLLIFIEDQGPIFYTQKRVGLKGKNFKIFKLRTMRLNSENGKAIWATEKDPRITRIGNFLRKSRIDEIPQLWNVIRNDMSLIGPRPERPELENNLLKELPAFSLRSYVLPGLSGWAQVNYPYASSLSESEMKLSFDLFYIKNASFFLDLIIFFKTIKLVINRKGSIPNKSIE